MARLLLLICLVCVVLALAGVAVSSLSRAARELAPANEGKTMARISYAALLLLMLGVTSGLLGGL